MEAEAVQSDLSKLREDMMVSARQVLSTDRYSPDNDNFHQARYRLYDIATRDLDIVSFQSLMADTQLQDLAKQVFSVSCEAGILEECAIAEELLQKPKLTFGHIYRNYYGKIYEALMVDELSYLQTRPDIIIEQECVAYLGGGAMPIPAMILAQKTGCSITMIDPDEKSCLLAQALIKRVGLDHLIKVVQMAGQDFDYSETDIVFSANWIPSKAAIFQRLGEFSNVKYCIFRSAADQSPSFIINDFIQLCDVCAYGFKLEHKTAKRQGVSLVSMIFGLSERPEKKCYFRKSSQKKTRIINQMTDLIGNTPMLRLDPEKTGLKNIDVYAKLEHLNPFGSIKDRTAWGMLKPHIADIKAKGKTVLELSSGNAARGLQAISSIYGTKLETVSNRIRVREMREMLLLQGTQITPITGIDSSDAYAALNKVDETAAEQSDKYFYTDQYRNPNNDGTHYTQTGQEIAEDLGRVDIFAGAVGTAGSTVGISRRLREVNPYLEVIGVVSDKDDFIPGIRHKDEIFNVGPFDANLYDHISAIHPDVAIDGMLELTRLYGIMPGPSSGATYMAVMSYLKEIDNTLTQRKTAVFVVCDRAEMYLSWLTDRRPDLFKI